MGKSWRDYTEDEDDFDEQFDKLQRQIEEQKKRRAKQAKKNNFDEEQEQ